ncbi:hypothetical protein K1719_046978 [Acacia pycnantha]|nr:hypothetical protein K1719_046978 [Acacia pycnantha]
MPKKKANLANKRLNKLELSWERDKQSLLQVNEEKILEVLQPHMRLKTFLRRGYPGTQLPQKMGNPTVKDLSFLKFMDCKNLFGILSLGQLPSLKRLSSSHKKHMQYMDDQSYVDGVDGHISFPALDFLMLERLPSLMKLSKEKETTCFHVSQRWKLLIATTKLAFPSICQLTKTLWLY